VYFTLIGTMTLGTTRSPFIFTPPWFWLTAGIILWGIELFLPKNWAKKWRLIPLLMGGTALLLSFTLWRLSMDWEFDWQYIMYGNFSLQIMYWMGVSLSTIIWIRPAILSLKQKKFTIANATEAKTLTEILPGETGRVLYEGSSWPARCAENSDAIASHQKVYVLRCEDNTLIVASDTLFRS